MTKSSLFHSLLTFFKKLDSSLPSLSNEPQAMQRPGFKLLLHGTVVTIETGPLHKRASSSNTKTQ